MPDNVTPTPTPFLKYLVDNIPNHLKVLAAIGIVAGGWYAFNTIRDLRQELKAQEASTATLSEKFQQIGTASQAGNTTAPVQQVTTSAGDAFGSVVLKHMQDEDAVIASLSSIIGVIKTTATPQPTVLQTPFNDTTHNVSGALTGYRMDEARLSGPPLASVNLFYDPAQTDPAKAFSGTTWTHNQEQFGVDVGDWISKKDGGKQTIIKLTRTVSKPDPLDPTKLTVLGTETVPITGANTVYTPDGLVDPATLFNPRWTLDIGLAKTFAAAGTNKYTGVGTIDYRLTNKLGVFAGTANGGLIGGISIRLDAK